ncbi:hypothetical protein C464_05450 [Halorubrum coriense DSM 10284]|uniref:Uncharacterized protein n=1 Tax=Halorubrum coriense DSM 10284 TaxID=1227466 RepID=M0EM63_9EURY|nr:hypothetical protein C464_05450 [Halorubrum coriense DSM 10284]
MREVRTEFRFTGTDFSFDDDGEIPDPIIREFLVDAILAPRFTSRGCTAEDLHGPVRELEEVVILRTNCSDLTEQSTKRLFIDFVVVWTTCRVGFVWFHDLIH